MFWKYFVFLILFYNKSFSFLIYFFIFYKLFGKIDESCDHKKLNIKLSYIIKNLIKNIKINKDVNAIIYGKSIFRYFLEMKYNYVANVKIL